MIENNFQLFLQCPLLVVKYLGVYSPSTHNILYKIYGVFILAIQYCGLTCVVIYLGTEWGNLNMDTITQYCFYLFSITNHCVKVSAMFFNNNVYKKFLDSMNDNIFVAKSSAQEKILLKEARKMRYLHTIQIGLAVLASFLFAWIPSTSQGVRTFSFWLPLNAESSLGFALGYTFQITFTTSSCTLFQTMDSFGFTSIIFGCAQLDIIKDKIRKIRNVPPESDSTDRTEREQLLKNNNKQLNDCIDHHQHIVRFIQTVEKLFNIILFLCLCATVMMICLIGVQLSYDSPNSFNFYLSLCYLCCILIPLFCYCWSGSELTSRCEELRDELYQCPWYEQDRPFRRTILIAMECKKRPIVFRAGNHIPLSRPTFVSILRCSYSYFAVLNQVAKDE